MDRSGYEWARMSTLRKSGSPDPKVFLRAIQRLNQRRDTVCCYAIDKNFWKRLLKRQPPVPELTFFIRLMKPKNRHMHERWWHRDDFGSRIIALQLAACVCADVHK